MITFLKIGTLQETDHIKEVRLRDKTIVVDALKLSDVLKGNTEEFVQTTLSAFLDRRFLLQGIDTAGIIITTLGQLTATTMKLYNLRIAEKKEMSDDEKQHLEHLAIVVSALLMEEKAAEKGK